jgi:hypothetical protein
MIGGVVTQRRGGVERPARRRYFISNGVWFAGTECCLAQGLVARRIAQFDPVGRASPSAICSVDLAGPSIWRSLDGRSVDG